MKRILLLTAAVLALVASGSAVAKLTTSDGTQVGATLSATTVAHLTTRTLTCEGQTVEVSHGRYTGAAASTTAGLAGPLELRVESVYNVTKKLGWLEGTLRLRAADNRSVARLTAVNVDGRLDGWVRGSAGFRDGQLVGSLTGSFTKDGGLTGGQLGTGTGPNAALILRHARCTAAAKAKASVHLTVRGQVDALSETSISVKPADGGASQACRIDARKPTRLAIGDRVEMTCAQVGGAWVLRSVHRRG